MDADKTKKMFDSDKLIEEEFYRQVEHTQAFKKACQQVYGGRRDWVQRKWISFWHVWLRNKFRYGIRYK